MAASTTNLAAETPVVNATGKAIYSGVWAVGIISSSRDRRICVFFSSSNILYTSFVIELL